MKKNFIIKRGNPVIKRKRTTCVATFSGGEAVVGITNFKGKVVIATTKAVYIYPKKKRRKV